MPLSSPHNSSQSLQRVSQTLSLDTSNYQLNRMTGAIAAMFVPYVIRRFPGHLIFLGSMLAFLIGAIMAAVAPAGGPYWAVTFPSMILVIAGPGTTHQLTQLESHELIV